MVALFGRQAASPFEELRGGLVLGGDGLWEKVRGLLDAREGQEEIRWRAQADERIVRRQVGAMLTGEPDARVRIRASAH
jgi:hypothetical protein